MQTQIFWEEAFENCFNGGILNEEKIGRYSSWLNLTRDINEEVDLEPLKYLKNLRQLHLLCPKLTNKKYISKLESLRSIVLNSPSLNQDDLRLLIECKQLKTIHICNMAISSFNVLVKLPKLSELILYKIGGLSAPELSVLWNITSLELKDCDIGDLNDLSKMKKLKKLSFSKMKLGNLEFLNGLSLSKFESEFEALNEEGLHYLSKMSGLKELFYPLSNFDFLKGLNKLESVLIDTKRKIDINTLANFPIKMVDIHYTDSVGIAHKIRDEIRQIHPNCQFEFTRKWINEAINP